MRYFLLTIILLFTTTTNAGELGISLRSHHVENETANENNFGVHYRDNGYAVGIYKNSHNRTSVYAQKMWETPIPRTTFGAGLVSGYEKLFIATLNVDLDPVVVTYAPSARGGVFLLSVVVWEE